jgi:soluble P-type ATPase
MATITNSSGIYQIVNNLTKKRYVVTGDTYNSLAELVEATGIPKYELSRRLGGRRKNNTNYKFVA